MRIKKLVAAVLAAAAIASVGALCGCGDGETGATGPAGPAGATGEHGKSAYEIAKENGFKGTEAEWLESLKGSDGASGKSAYELAKDKGYTGTENEWLAGLVGATGSTGKSAYELATESGFEGTLSEWLTSLKGATGATGKSAYEIAKENGFTGSESAWLESLKGANGLDGQCTITSLNYINYFNYKGDDATFDKWGIQHRLKITYLNEDSQVETVISDDTLNIVNQNVFYEAGTSDEIWQLIGFNVRRIGVTDNILWTGNVFVDHSADKTPVTKYTSRIELSNDLELDINGNEIVLEADLIEVTGNASVTFKNGSIKRINRITTDDESLYGKISDKNIMESGKGVEHIGRSVYVPAYYPDGKAVASDGELKRTAVYNRLSVIPEGKDKVIAPDANSGANSNSTIHVSNYCSLRLDTVDYFTFFTGIFVDGLSSSVDVVNNSVIDAEGTFGIATNATSSEYWNVVVNVSDSVINASSVNDRRTTIPESFCIATALMINVPGSVVIQNSELIGTSQALIVRGGHAVARNSRLYSYGVFPYTQEQLKDKWYSSNTVPNATVVVGNKHTSYQYAADCTLTNCEIKADIYKEDNGVFNKSWETVYVNGNAGVKGDGLNKNGEWIGATFTYDAMTFARSGNVNFHVENATEKSANVYRPEMLLNANEWYEADTQRKVRDLMDYGAKNIRLVNDLQLEANADDGYTYIDRDINIGLNGHTLDIVSKGIKIVNNADFKMQNGIVVMNGTPAPAAGNVDGNYAIEVGEFAALALETVKMYANRSGIFMNGKAATLEVAADSEINVGGFYAIGTNVNGSTDFGVMVTVRYSKIRANGTVDIPNVQTTAAQGANAFGVGILFNVPGTLKIEKSSVVEGLTQGIVMRDGIAVIENSSVNVTGTNSALDRFEGTTHDAWGRGYLVPNAAIVMGTYKTASEARDNLYRSPVDVTLRNVALGKAQGGKHLVFIHNDGEDTAGLGTTTLTFDKLTKLKSGVGDGETIYTVCDGQTDLEANKIIIWDETV